MEIAAHPEYFGNGIEEVRVVVKNIPLSNILVMGADKSSVKISYNNVDYVKFKDAGFVEEVQNNSDKTLTIYGRFNRNSFNGRISLQVFFTDYEFEEAQLNINKYDF